MIEDNNNWVLKFGKYKDMKYSDFIDQEFQQRTYTDREKYARWLISVYKADQKGEPKDKSPSWKFCHYYLKKYKPEWFE